MSCTNKTHILEIDELSVSFLQYENDRSSRQVELPVISRLSVSVHEGEIVAVVGSSGSGKSLLAHAVLGMLPYNAQVTGDMYFEGELLSKERIEALRGNQIAFVPQSTTYLDPLMSVGAQVRNGKGEEKAKKQRGLFKRYGLSKDVDKKYPFECSGGMTRRVLLTTAMMGNPKLIIADEPTPGMDLALAKKSMEDFRAFADEGNGVLLITHDIELALEVADRIAVFYAGTTVEETVVADFKSEETLRHPYTKALWRALPQNGFQPLPGVQPYVKDMPKGCPFGPRCEFYSEECQGEIPMQRVGCGSVRCVKAHGAPIVVEHFHPDGAPGHSHGTWNGQHEHIHGQQHVHVDQDGSVHVHVHGGEVTHMHENGEMHTHSHGEGSEGTLEHNHTHENCGEHSHVSGDVHEHSHGEGSEGTHIHEHKHNGEEG